MQPSPAHTSQHNDQTWPDVCAPGTQKPARRGAIWLAAPGTGNNCFQASQRCFSATAGVCCRFGSQWPLDSLKHSQRRRAACKCTHSQSPWPRLHRRPCCPWAGCAELVAPSWVEWGLSPPLIRRAPSRMHPSSPHQAHGARNFPLSDSCADQVAVLHDSSFKERPDSAFKVPSRYLWVCFSIVDRSPTPACCQRSRPF